MNLFDVYPLNQIVIEKALGTRVLDNKGQEYLDMYGGHAVISIGHTHPHWVKKIEDQLKAIAFYSNSVIIEQQSVLAKKLGIIAEKEDYQLFLCNSGAEANENAMKLASFHTGRKKIISFKNGFHGRTSLAVAVTDNPSIIAPVNETENVIILPFNDEQALEDTFNNHGSEIAAVIIEGIQGIGGIHEASIPFLNLIRLLCDKHGAVYIADSVQCGYGRSGLFFAHDVANSKADIYTTAKGMGNGFPVGGILIAPQIKPKHGMLGTTFGGNYLACAASIAVIEVMDQENLISNAQVKGEHILTRLRTYEAITAVRGRGLMIGFEVDKDHQDLRSNLLNKHRIFTGNAKPNVIRLLPSLAIDDNSIDEFFNALDQELK
jgi:acetylornithine aminotransferase